MPLLFKTFPLAPKDNFVNVVEPVATRISPDVYTVWPVPPLFTGCVSPSNVVILLELSDRLVSRSVILLELSDRCVLKATPVKVVPSP